MGCAGFACTQDEIPPSPRGSLKGCFTTTYTGSCPQTTTTITKIDFSVQKHTCNALSCPVSLNEALDPRVCQCVDCRRKAVIPWAFLLCVGLALAHIYRGCEHRSAWSMQRGLPFRGQGRRSVTGVDGRYQLPTRSCMLLLRAPGLHCCPAPRLPGSYDHTVQPGPENLESRPHSRLTIRNTHMRNTSEDGMYSNCLAGRRRNVQRQATRMHVCT